MPITAHVNTRLVRAWEYRAERDTPLTCPECGDPMHFRPRVNDPRRVAHFAHNPRTAAQGARDCDLRNQTPEHLNAKDTLLKMAASVFKVECGKQEHRFCEGKRVADVFFPSGAGRFAVAFEAQFSPIKFAADGERYTIESRTEDYHAAGVHIVWCLPEKRRHLIETVRRVFGCYGVLSDDGLTVEFYGVNALFLNQHPASWLEGRRNWQAAQERKRLQELRQEERERQEKIAEQERERQAAREQDAITLANIGRARLFRQQLGAIHEFDAPEPQAVDPPPLYGPEAKAFHGWKSGGSMGLGHWLAGYIRASENRGHTTADYGKWVRVMQDLEKTQRTKVTCACCGRFAHQHETRLVLCEMCGNDLPRARALVVDTLLRVEDLAQTLQDRADCARERLDAPRLQWWRAFQEAQESDPARVDAAVAKAYSGDGDLFFDALRAWLIYQEVGDVYTARQEWAREMENILVDEANR